jgi:hypothetical protein
MKVSLGKFPTYVGPWQVAQALLFWMPQQKDECGLPMAPKPVRDLGYFLAYGELRKEPTPASPYTDTFRTDRTAFANMLGWFNGLFDRRCKVKIERHDLYDVPGTVSLLIVPLLEKLLESLDNGPFNVEDKDLPKELRRTEDEDWDYDREVTRSRYVIEQMLFSFKEILDPSLASEGNVEYLSKAIEWNEKGEATLFEIEQGPNHTATFDIRKVKARQKKVDTGLRLFAKYLQQL